jgi:hypothetical protein
MVPESSEAEQRAWIIRPNIQRSIVAVVVELLWSDKRMSGLVEKQQT